MISRENLIYLIQEVCQPNENDGIHSETGRKFGRDYPREYNDLLEYTSFVTKNSFNERYRVLKYGWTEYPKCANPECDEIALSVKNITCGKKNCGQQLRNISMKKKTDYFYSEIDNVNTSMITRENLILLIEQICKPNLKLTIKNSLSLNFQINFIPEYKLLLELTKFVKENSGGYFNERYRVLKLGWTDYPICKAEGCYNKIKSSSKEYCGCNLGRLIQLKETFLEKYGEDCYLKTDEGRKMISEKVKIAYQTKDVMEKRKKTNLEKYGVEHHMQNKEQMEKIIESTTLKYGGMGSASEETKLKVENTNLEKYGFKSFSQTEEFKERVIETNLEKYGFKSFLETEKFKEKSKKTMIDNYGVENIFSHKTYIKEKMMDKHGVENPSELAWVQSKKQQTSFKKKEYKWKTGEISIVQGYEPFVLEKLEEEGFLFEEIITENEKIPKIEYIDEKNKKRIYFPDIFISKLNLIIEVKSEWTMLREFNKNMRKFSAVKKEGFKFELVVLSKDSKRKI